MHPHQLRVRTRVAWQEQRVSCYSSRAIFSSVSFFDQKTAPCINLVSRLERKDLGDLSFSSSNYREQIALDAGLKLPLQPRTPLESIIQQVAG